METISTDVLILGAGAAGIRAAIEASHSDVQVLVLAAEEVAAGGSTFSNIANGWGIQALEEFERTDENYEAFYEDIMRVGLGQCDPKLVRILAEESGSRFDDLRSYGLRFKRENRGEYLRARGCFSEVQRAFLTEDIRNVRQSFLSIIRRLPVRIVTGSVTDLLVYDGVCQGARIWLKSPKFIEILAKSTVLATGGGSGVFKDNLAMDSNSGDGYALAHLAGAELRNMEFIQFALGLKGDSTRRFLPIDQLNRCAKVTDSSGHDVLNRYLPKSSNTSRLLEKRNTHMPFSCRDSAGLIDIAIAEAAKKNGKLYWRGNGETEKEIQICHFAHAFNGGVRINEQGESTVPGLFAAGEVAAGPHGADRIGGCMMTATQVFGKRCGQFAARRAKKLRAEKSVPTVASPAVPCSYADRNREATEVLATLKRRIKEAMRKHAAILRDKRGLRKCSKQLSLWIKQLGALGCLGVSEIDEYYRVRNMAITANQVVDCALARQESRGSHFRRDDKKFKFGKPYQIN